MGLMSFIKGAGEKLFGTARAAEAPAAASAPKPDIDALNKTAAQAIAQYIGTQNLQVQDLDVRFDAASATVTVAGSVQDQATKEKVLLCCGNVAGVEQVDDRLTVLNPQPEAKFHTVVSGDNLSKIAKAFYGDANKHPLIFEANRPMLKHPDKIYPGQVLRIPPL